jgi:hypothetical protein
MGLLRRVFGGADARAVAPGRVVLRITEPSAPMLTREEARELATAGEAMVELHIVGESFRQDALAAISGPKEELSKEMRVGATLRCEPTCEYDPNAVRVEVMGQHVGYVARDQAALLAAPLASAFGGAIEARALIVGGWRDAFSEGHYGIRVWIAQHDSARLGIPPSKLDLSLRAPWPQLPSPGRDERRLGPTEADVAAERWGSDVTVTCEEHYQAAILGAMPAAWDDRTWPLLVELDVVDRNPHSKHDTACVGVKVGSERAGYFTPAMTERFRPLVESTLRSGVRATAEAKAHQGTKGGATFWRLKVTLQAVRTAEPAQRA